MITTKNLSNYLIECLEKKSQAQLPSNTIPDFSLSDAYSIAVEIKEKREKKEEKVAGIKVGFTNKTIWDKYSVNAPIFGFMYSSTVLNKDQSFVLEKFLEPKFEPEIFFKLSKKPRSEMSDMDLISCCNSFGIGVELVQSIYEGWTFTLPDTVAGFGLHGQYKILREMTIPSDQIARLEIINNLKNFPDLRIVQLTEEHGTIISDYSTNLEIGQKIQIIPNHACVVTNMLDEVTVITEERNLGNMQVIGRGKVW